VAEAMSAKNNEVVAEATSTKSNNNKQTPVVATETEANG
jgi:hypothetical protein